MCVSPSTGKNFLYRVSVENGDPVVNNLDTLDPADADDERVTELAQGGIAPTPAIPVPQARSRAALAQTVRRRRLVASVSNVSIRALRTTL